MNGFKKIFLYTFLLSVIKISYVLGAGPGNVSDKTIHWLSYKTAMKEAQVSAKHPVLFFTGSDWCIWCLRMEEEILSCPEFIQYAEKNFLMVKVDFPMGESLPADQSKENEELKSKYRVSGYPTLVVLDKSGKVVFEDGYIPGGGKEYVKKLQKQLGKKK